MKTVLNKIPALKSLFKNTPTYTVAEANRILYNVGSLLDIPTGKYVRGVKGENILLGGLAAFTAIIGKPNTYKSKVSRHMNLAAADTIASYGTMPYMELYDTEITADLDHLSALSKRYDSFKDIDIVKDGMWKITDKSRHSGNEWFKMLRDFLIGEKVKNAKAYETVTPFLDKDGNTVKVIYPTLSELDSVSEFATDDIEDIQNKNELGESGGNTIHMRLGLAKTRLMMEIPSLCNRSGHYMTMTAHVGKEIAVSQGPMSFPTKQLPHMKPGEVVKGVSVKFLYLAGVIWETMSSATYNNKDTKGPEYPKRQDYPDPGSLDLNLVNLKLIRCKTGASGYSVDLVISQTEGVLPSLSEFNYIKDKDSYGLQGSSRNYSLVLYPEVSLSRTTVREKIDSDPVLRRALKITADMLQIKTYFKTLPFEVPTPEELYAKLAETYDWKKLLATRDYWTFNQYEHPVPFLSTMDLIEMYHGLYKPYWWK